MKRAGGVDNDFAMLKGGYTKFWGRFYAVAGSYCHVDGGYKKFPLFKRGGGAQKFGPVIFPF